MRLARKVEIQPTPTQWRALLQHAGNARWAYNWGLRRKQQAWEARKAALAAGTSKEAAPKIPTAIDLHRDLNALKKLPVEAGGVPWMYEASKCAPQEALRNLDRAFDHFFRRVKAGGKAGYPRFKSRHQGIGGFTLTGKIRGEDSVVVLPTLGRVRIKPGDHGYISTGTYSAATITERAGRWFVSVLGPEVVEVAGNGGPAVGLDLGVVRLATLSDGTVFENPRALAAATRKLRHLQKEVSRKRRGSMNRRKAICRLAGAHARVSHVRADVLHKATTAIAKRYSRVCIEDLKVWNMTRRAHGRGRSAKSGLNRSVLDASFAEFRRLLEYKAKLHGSEVVIVPAAYTSQRCSRCGHTAAENRISQAEFRCVVCGYESNADENAAINILVAGSCPETRNACGAGVSPAGLRVGRQSAVKQESAWS